MLPSQHLKEVLSKSPGLLEHLGHHSLAQQHLEEKLVLFMQTKGEESKIELCNGLAFRNFVAAAISESHILINRINLILNFSDANIVSLARLHNEYFKFTESLRLIKNDSELGKLNIKILNDQNKLKEESEEKKAIVIKNLENLRNQREHYIHQFVILKFGYQVFQINFAIEIYHFIHAVMAATNPADLNLTANDIPLRQEDFELMIGLYPPDKFHKNNLKIEKVFSVSFNFSERELLHLFSSSYASHTFKEGDLILLNGCDHTMFATIQNGQFILYNPLPLIFSDPNIFVAVLWKFLSSAERLHEKYTALGINIYEALTPDQKVSARPMRSKIIKKIMDDSTDIERKSRDESVLWTAAYYGHEDTFESLIKHRAPILYKSHSGTTVALAAAMNNQQRILESIYQISKNLLLRKDNKNHTPLKFAAQFGNIEFLKLTVGMFKPGEYLEAAQIAIRDEKKEFLKFLLDNKLISNSDILVIAKVATYLKKTHMLILLGSYGLDLKDDSLMTYAVIQNSLPIVRYLGEEKALRERSDRTPLVMEAVIKGSEKMVHLLHEYKISVNIIDSHTGYTPAHVAIRNNKSSLLQALAECKADFNIPDLKGKTALHYAVTKQDTATIALLITHGAKYDITDSKHQTPFDYASPELKYFIILQQFRVFIKTQYNDEDRPFYLSTCLKIINDSESTKQWEEAFKKLRERILAQYPYATKKQRTHPILIPSIKNDDIEYFINLCAELPLQRSLSSQNKKRKEI